MDHYIIDGAELDSLMSSLIWKSQTSAGVHTLRIMTRREGVAIKVNGGEWSPTIGRKVSAS